MHIKELWRYPVKSMAGETISEATVGPLGIEGDRMVQVWAAGGRVVTARTHARLLGHRGSLGPDGEPLVDGRLWSDPGVRTDVERIVGTGARLVRNPGPDRFDVLPLLVATDGALAEFGHDGRRLRPNIVVGGVTGLAERTWQALRLRIGEVVIQIADLRGRCVMTTYDPDTLEQDHGVLNGIVRRFGGRLALNGSVIRGGIIRIGDSVELIGTTGEGPLDPPAGIIRNRHPVS
jgi:hypothetical protein